MYIAPFPSYVGGKGSYRKIPKGVGGGGGGKRMSEDILGGMCIVSNIHFDGLKSQGGGGHKVSKGG